MAVMAIGCGVLALPAQYWWGVEHKKSGLHFLQRILHKTIHRQAVVWKMARLVRRRGGIKVRPGHGRLRVVPFALPRRTRQPIVGGEFTVNTANPDQPGWGE
jgi:hypothetical protein